MRLPIVAFWLVLTHAAEAQTDVRSLLQGSDVRRAEVLVKDRMRFTPLVVGLLKDGNADVRRRAALALRDIDSRWDEGEDTEERWRRGEKEEAAFRKAAIPALRIASRDSDATVRDEAMRSLLYVLRLRKFGHHGEPILATKDLRPLLDLGPAVVPTLIVALRPSGDESPWVQFAAARALSRLKPPAALSTLLAASTRLGYSVLDETMLALAEYDDPRVAPAILDCLGARLDEDYYSGIKALRRTRGRAVPDAVRRLARETNAPYRSAIVKALGFPPDPRALSALVNALEDSDEEVRASACHSLARYPQPVSVSGLLRACHDPSRCVRYEAMRSLGVLRDPRAFSEIAKALADPSVDIRQVAENALLAIDGKKAIPLVLPSIEAGVIGLEARTRLREIRDRRTVPALLACFRATHDLDSAQDLAAFGEREPIAPLMEWFGTARTADQVASTMSAFGPLAADALIDFYPESHPSVRFYLIEAMGSTKDPRAIPLLRPVAAGKDDAEAAAALAALGQLGDRASIPLLIEKLKHPNWSVACSAAEGLESLKAYQAVTPLLAMLRRKEGYAEDYAAMALATIGDPRAVEPLIRYLGDDENPWRDRVVSRLGTFRDPRMTQFLLEELDEGDVVSACEALVQRGDPSVLPELRRVLDCGDENVYEAVKSAIERLAKL